MQSIKNAVFRISGALLRRGPLAPLARRYFRERSAIVYYHGVWADDDSVRRRLFGGMRVSDFADELRRLKQFFDVVPLSRIIAGQTNNSPRPVLAITFDDGLDLTTAGATDVLDQQGIKATMFINTASLAGGHLMWMHRFSAIRSERGDEALLAEFNRFSQHKIPALNELIAATRAWPQEMKDEWVDQMWRGAGMEPLPVFLEKHRPYLTIDGVKNWLGRGHEIGFHTHSHPFCSRLDDELLERELVDPVANLKSSLGLNEIAFAYPFGDRCRPEHEAKLRQNGLFSALIGTAGFSRNPVQPHALERIDAEPGVDREVFGKPVLRSYKRSSRST